MSLYGNIEDWRAYALARGNNAPTNASDIDATAALQRASDYILLRYVRRFELDESAPDVIESAYIAANYEITKPGFWTGTYTPAQAKVLTKAGKLEWTPVSSSAGSSSASDIYMPVDTFIDAMLSKTSSTASIGAMVV